MGSETRPRRRAALAATVAGVAIFFFGGWTLRNKLAADRQGEWVRVTRGDLVTGVEVTGTLAAVQSDSLGPPQIRDVWELKLSMMAPEGTEVKQGRPVIGFDTTELQRRLDTNRAVAEQAKKEIEKKRADVRLQREDNELQLAEAEASMRKLAMKLEAPPDLLGLKERKEVQLDYDVSKREVAAIRARLADVARAAAAAIRLLESKQHQAEAVVSNTEDAIRRMTVLAPRDGTIVYTTDWRGDKHKIGDTVWRAEHVMEIPDLRTMKASGEVDESDAGKIAVRQRVVLRLDAHPDDEIRGTITSASRTVQQQARTRNPVKVLRVEIALDKTDPAKMRPGMRFQGTVELARVRNAVLIPREAVFVSAKGPVAYRRGPLSVSEVPLKLGRENDKAVEVLSGLSANDRVLVSKAQVKEGTKS
jgi:multidrug efflux pump subunit AcrA (membrane-fusion protein)